MPELSFSKVALSLTIRFDGGPFTPPRFRGRALPQTRTEAMTVNGSPDPGGAITLATVGGASWLTVPGSCSHGVAFNVGLDAGQLKPGRYSETVRASRAGYPDADLVVSLLVVPSGGKA